MWLDSEAGKGSTFHFIAVFSLQKDAPIKPAPGPVTLHGLRVLVVDDNKTNRLILQEMLNNWRMNPTVADMDGFGATLYHIVTGKVPFEGSDVSSILLKHLDEPIVPPDHINPELTNGIGEIIEFCMAKEPGKRYATTIDLIEDLQAVADGRPPVQARKLIDLSALTSLDQESNADASGEAQSEVSLITTPHRPATAGPQPPH